jgi:hypothetical protein
MNKYRKTIILNLALISLSLGALVPTLSKELTDEFSEDALYTNVFNFPLDEVTNNCKFENNYSNEDMVLLERELKRFLYLCIKHESLPMFSSHVDNLWHTFILFTHKYHAFCNLNGGQYIHHTPRKRNAGESTDEHKLFILEKMHTFITIYEQTFNVQIDPIWLLDSAEHTS